MNSTKASKSSQQTKEKHPPSLQAVDAKKVVKQPRRTLQQQKVDLVCRQWQLKASASKEKTFLPYSLIVSKPLDMTNGYVQLDTGVRIRINNDTYTSFDNPKQPIMTVLIDTPKLADCLQSILFRAKRHLKPCPITKKGTIFPEPGMKILEGSESPPATYERLPSRLLSRGRKREPGIRSLGDSGRLPAEQDKRLLSQGLKGERKGAPSKTEEDRKFSTDRRQRYAPSRSSGHVSVASKRPVDSIDELQGLSMDR